MTIATITAIIGVLLLFSVMVWGIVRMDKEIDRLNELITNWSNHYSRQVRETQDYYEKWCDRNIEILKLQEQLRNNIQRDNTTFSLIELREHVVALLHENGMTGSNQIEVAIWDHEHVEPRQLSYSISVSVFRYTNVIKQWKAINPETLLSLMREFFIGYNAQAIEIKDVIINSQTETDVTDNKS